MVERKDNEAPVDGHEQAVAAQSAKAENGSFRAHVYVGPEGSEAPTSSMMRRMDQSSRRYREIHTIPRSQRRNKRGDSCR
jgi:hypothetical protein